MTELEFILAMWIFTFGIVLGFFLGFVTATRNAIGKIGRWLDERIR